MRPQSLRSFSLSWNSVFMQQDGAAVVRISAAGPGSRSQASAKWRLSTRSPTSYSSGTIPAALTLSERPLSGGDPEQLVHMLSLHPYFLHSLYFLATDRIIFGSIIDSLIMSPQFSGHKWIDTEKLSCVYLKCSSFPTLCKLGSHAPLAHIIAFMYCIDCHL